MMNKIKNNLKIAIIIFFTIIVATILMGLITNIPILPFFGGTTLEWLSYWGGIIGSFIGVFGAYYVMSSQIKKEKIREEEKEVPLIFLSNQNPFKIKHYNTNYAIKDALPIEVRIINGGRSPVFLIEWEIYLTVEVINFLKDKYEVKEIGGTFMIDCKNKKRLIKKNSIGEPEYIDILMPGESIGVNLPNEINIVLTLYFMARLESYEFSEDIENLFKIDIMYKDHNENDKISSFNLTNFKGKFNMMTLIFEENTGLIEGTLLSNKI